MIADWQSFKENIQRGNKIRKEIAELNLLVPRKPEVVQCKTATVHYHQTDNTDSWVLAIVILLCVLTLLLVMLAHRVIADNTPQNKAYSPLGGGMPDLALVPMKEVYSSSGTRSPGVNGVTITPKLNDAVEEAQNSQEEKATAEGSSKSSEATTGDSVGMNNVLHKESPPSEDIHCTAKMLFDCYYKGKCDCL